MAHTVLIKSLPEITVAYRRLVIPYHEELIELMSTMDQELAEMGCKLTEPIYCFNIYYDGEYKEENIDVEICESVIEAKEGSQLVNFKIMPHIDEAVCVLHKGPYTSLGEAYGAAFEWIENNEYELIDNPRESYIDGIWNKANEDNWLTEIQCPIRKKQ